MLSEISLALNWILFLALFPMAFFWLRRTWRIKVRHDFSEVALKHGEPPNNAQKYANYTFLVNLVAGGVVLFVIGGIIFAGLHYDIWTALVGATIWCKLCIDFVISRSAHAKYGTNKQVFVEND